MPSSVSNTLVSNTYVTDTYTHARHTKQKIKINKPFYLNIRKRTLNQ